MIPRYWRWFKTVGYLLVLPVPIIGLVPWGLHQRVEGSFVWTGDPWQWMGLWLILNGIGLAAWCVTLFNHEGQGTPLPIDPPIRCVVSGPYRFVRNPMSLGIFLTLLGEAALYRSYAVFIYGLMLMVMVVVFVRYVEEPGLTRRFGEAYLIYKRQIPRWIPRSISVSQRGK